MEEQATAARSNGPSAKSWLDIGRLISLSDGIFAFAMTLLVVTIDIPGGAKGLQGEELHRYLLSQWRPLLVFFQSFLLLSIFWVTHHRQFGYYRRTDHRHTWISLGILLFVVLMPYTTDLLGDTSGDWMVQLIFAVNMLALGLLFSLNWQYATAGYRLVDPGLSREIINRGRRRGLVVPLCSLGAGVLAFVAPHQASWFYLLIPIALSFKPFRT
ncbi:MAG: TMEM175 family protein [Coprothermobacterota bacterium]|nr:TMEM175 family protein [Coprothermobacterota bacterium]